MRVGIEFEGVKNHIYGIDNQVKNLRKLKESIVQQIQLNAALTGERNIVLEQSLAQIARLEDSFLARIQFLEQLVEDFQMIGSGNHVHLDEEIQAVCSVEEW